MLSTTNAAPVLHHTNEFSVPKAIRSASSPSGSFPTVQHARVTSLDIDPRPASGSTSGPASASASRTHSLSTSPSVSQLYPRSSILINSRKRRYSGVIYANPTVVAGSSSPAAPVVTHIPAVPSRKEREKERERAREREKERERERERAKSKDEEKIWGIPKKALLLGLGDLNFNAQMAMMAGWGHGSGGASILPSTAIPTSNDRKRLRPSSSAELPRSSSSSRRSAKHSDSEDDDNDGDNTGKRSSSSRHASRSASEGGAHDSSNRNDGGVSSSPTEEPMDPEELAALNAIINTRRSMAAAQALVSGSLSMGPRALRASTNFGSSAQDLSRPPLEGKRFESQDSVPSMSSVGHSSLSIGSSSQPPTTTSEQALQLPAANASSSATTTTTTLDAAEIKSARIRFAPLPTPTSAPAMLGRGSDSLNGEAVLEDSDESDLTDSAYDSDDDAKSMKGKWYLMGMPSAYFKPQYYTGKSSKRRLSKSNAAADGDDRSEDGNSSLRRKSTGSLSDGTMGPDAARRTASENDEEERGRGGASGSKVKRKSSQSRRRSRSRTGAISSGDEDERARRRELIRLARPGGTGMVTLPDGTKIRARRVNDQPSQDEPEFIEWGFAGLAREASRRSLGGGSGPPSLATTPNGSDYRGLSAYMEAEEEEEDDGSGMAWVRRRRREREAKARMEREQAEKAAAEAAAQGGQPTQMESATAEPKVQESVASVSATKRSTATAAPEATTTSIPTTTLADPAISMTKDATPAPLDDEPMPLSSSDATTQPEAIAATPHKAKRQSQLSTIDTSRPVSGGMFADASTLVASPTAEELPSASLEASMLSESSKGQPASLGGSQILSMPSRTAAAESAGAPGDSTPRQNTGLGLTADKAEEIRRRHEDEVAALGAEVLAQTRRNNQRRQASSSSRGVATPLLGGEESAAEQHHQNSPSKSSSNRAGQGQVTSPASLSSPTMHSETSRESGASGKKSISRAVGSIMRKATTDSDKTVRQPGPTSLKQEVVFPQMAEPAGSKRSDEVSQTTTTTTASQKHKRDASSARSPSPESTLSRQSSAVDGYTASAASKSASSLHTVGSLHAASSPMSAKRMLLDPSVSTPAPLPWLPRRPDARGVAVVPLPQLGVRPERPREGRVWQWDDSDASDAGKDDLMRERREEEEEEEEGSDLDAEELLEEERKTAMQKKRATTRAAGQEVVHARLGKKASARALSDLTASYDEMAIAAAGSSSTSPRPRGDRKSRRRSMDPRMPSGPRKAPPKLMRSRRSLQSMQAGEGGEGQEEDEQDLWPAVSATSKSGTPRPRHILVNLPGGPGIWDSKTGGGRNAVAAINTVAAARAKAIKKRARDRRTSFELPPDWDDEIMDYGWPRSLKGSLY
ncbi:uncharacterized protein SPSC_00344 [Sporisorium scitamineum]|uniref:Uncharacterized protein n=1 Tax=Sporisorium scitamineum TaxID=49012 RepID=A0A0F7RW60_9BASI|nr:uncharacterized protein SPSC_00344 [Sporisorium scitamineum]CDS01226.1 hypothetical protein [Sporisorium scitamineum]